MGLRAILDYLRPKTHPVAPPPLPPTRSSTPLMPNFRWVGKGSEVRVGLFHLFEPLVYVYDGRRGRCDEPAAIDLSLSISGGSATPGIRELPYWPRYVDLQAHQRRIYLQWLANGRTTNPPELGYTFLFFYNLERRALIDRSDIRLVASEVVRLRKQYAAPGQEISGSWEGYSGRFLWVLMLVHKESLSTEDVRAHITGTSHWTEDNLAAALGCLVVRDVRLTASLAFSIASFLPESMRSIVQRRVPEEFEELFKKRFREQFPDGIEMRCSVKNKVFLYRPASNALPPMEVSFPNPMGIKSQFKSLSKIWNSCIDDLKKLGTLSRTGVEADAVRQWEALPDALRAGVDHPRTEDLCRLVESHTDEQGHAIITVDALAVALTPDEPFKMTVVRSRRLAQMAEQIGYCLEPDPRLTGRNYRFGEQINAFLKMSTAPINPARYGPAACMLQFGYLVATSDGKADGKEMEVISRHIESAFELQEDEVRRMDRLRALLDKTGPDKPLLRRLVRGLSKEQRQTIAKLLVAIVLTDGVVTAAERRALKAACTLLAIDFSAIESLLPAGVSDDPVTVVPGSRGVSGERIPTATDQGLVLNRDAIAAIMADTQQVAQMLAKVMSDPEEPEGEPEHDASPEPSVISLATQTSPQGALPSPDSPPAKYALIHAALLTKDMWPLSEAEALARSNGLMLSGVIDALNEWSCDILGGQLYFQDENCITLERSLLPKREG